MGLNGFYRVISWSLNGGIPKMVGLSWKSPTKIDDLGVHPYFRKPPYVLKKMGSYDSYELSFPSPNPSAKWGVAVSYICWLINPLYL